MRKWFLIIIISFAILLLLGAVALQALLWSDWPRQRVLAELQSKSGMVIDASSLSTGWLGHTELHDLTVRLPLADKPFAQAPTMRISHTALLPFIFGGEMRIDSLLIASPQLTIIQNSDGSWNLRRALDVLRNRVQNSSSAASPAAPASLPTLDIKNAQLTLINASGQSITIQDAAFKGQPNGPLLWTFQADAPGVAAASGRVTAASGWAHEINFKISNIHDELAVVIGESAPQPLAATGTWRGQVLGGQFTGAITLNAAQIGATSADGSASFALGQTIAISNPNLLVQNPSIPLGPVHILSGSLQLQNQNLRAEQLALATQELALTMNARADLATRSASIDAQVNGELAPAGVDYRGAVHASIDSPAVGQRRIAATLQGSGTMPGGQWQADLQTSASGPDWKNLAAQMNLPTLRWQSGEKSVDLSGLNVDAQIDWPAIRLANLQTPNAESEITGSFNADSKNWNLSATISKWRPPLHGFEVPTRPIDLALTASGNLEKIEVSNLKLDAEAVQLAGSGTYFANASTPLQAQTSLVYRFATPLKTSSSALTSIQSIAATQPANARPAVTQPAITQTPTPQPTSQPTSQPAPQPQTSGILQAKLQLQGDVRPLDLSFTGDILGENLPVASGSLPSIHVPLHGKFDSKLATFQSDDVKTLGGIVTLQGLYRAQTKLINVQLNGRDLALADLSMFVGSPVKLQGTLQTQAHIELPARDPEQLTITGNWESSDMMTPAGPVAHAQGQMESRANIIALKQMQLTGDGGAGSITGELAFNRTTRRVNVAVNSDNWPAHLPDRDVTIKTNGSANFDYDLKSNNLVGSADLRSTLQISGNHLGEINANLAADSRDLKINSLNATLLNGTIQGRGDIPFDDLARGRGDLQWNDVDLALIARFIPALESLEGTISGTGEVIAAPSPRAPGPVRITLNVHSTNAHSRTIALGDMQFTAYAGAGELTLENAHLQLAGGEFDIWGRMTRHDSDLYSHANIEYKQVQLDQLVHWLKPAIKPVPGLLHGSIAAGGYLSAPHRMFGEAEVNITESDLVNIPVFSLIHSALSLKIGELQPKGAGNATIRLEGDALDMSRLEYFNRGADIVAAAKIENIWQGDQSPISGVAVGAVRPLKDLNLPFFADIDRAIQAIQTGAVSVRIDGTLANPEDKIVPFAEISNAFRRIIGGSPQ